MWMPFHAMAYLVDFVDENAAAAVVWNGIMIGWHGEPSSLAKLANHPGILTSVVKRTDLEILHLPHWSFSEMREAFGCSLEQYLYFGGYPGAASLMDDPPRWRRYLLDSLVETTISRDVLLLTRVDKPVLLRRLFELGCRYSGQVLSYTKMLGQLHDAGNTTTLAHYLELLAGAGMLTGLPNPMGSTALVQRHRGGSDDERSRDLDVGRGVN